MTDELPERDDEARVREVLDLASLQADAGAGVAPESGAAGESQSSTGASKGSSGPGLGTLDEGAARNLAEAARPVEATGAGRGGEPDVGPDQVE